LVLQRDYHCGEVEEQQQPAAKASAEVLTLLPKAAALYRGHIAEGLDVDARAALTAHVFLRDCFSGKLGWSRPNSGWSAGELRQRFAITHPRSEPSARIAPAVQLDFPIYERWRLCADLAAAAGFRYYIVRRRLCPRKRERAMTAPHICVGSADGDTETSAPDV
jgi:hypothetical protein